MVSLPKYIFSFFFTMNLYGLSAYLYGQITPNTPVSGAVQFFTQTWQINDEDNSVVTAHQNVMPLSVYIPVTNRVETRLTTGYAKFSTEDKLGNIQRIDGFTDLKIQTGAALLAQRNLVLGVALNLPTGSDALSNTQQNVLQAFASPDLSIRENRFGAGFNAGTTLSYATTLKNRKTLLGGALGFVYNGNYDIVLNSDTLMLSPGTESTLALALIHRNGDRNLLISPSLSLYGVEKWDGVQALQLGPKVQLQSTYLFPLTNQWQVSVGLNQLLRLAPTVYNNNIAQRNTADMQPETTLILGAAYRFASGTTFAYNQVGRDIRSSKESALNTQVLESNFLISQSFSNRLSLSLGQRFIWGKGTYQQNNRTIQGNEGFVKAALKF
jgi:hypothetical protein